MSFASLAGITLGVGAIIVILSAMNGLEAESRARLLSMAEHVTLRPADGGTADFAALRARLAAVDGVAAVTPFVRLEAILRTPAGYRSALVRGIDPEAERDTDLAGIVGVDTLRSLEAGSNRIVLGSYVASDLRVDIGDVIEVLVPDVDAGVVNLDNRLPVTVAKVFNAGVDVHDDRLALMHLADAGRLLGLDGGPEGLAVRLREPMDVGPMELALREAVGPGFVWSNWASENRSLFQAMAIEKTMMTILMLFIVAVAAFNIVTSLTMVVNEKQKDIAILRTLGLEPERVMRVFLVQGAVLGIGGTLAGVAIGFSLSRNLATLLPWAERTFGFDIMPGDVFTISDVPFETRTIDLFLIPAIALLIALVATVLPSRRAARVDPAEALRYE